MKRTIAKAAVPVAALALMAGCAGGAAEIEANSDGQIPLKVGYQEQSLLSLPDWVAFENGQFEDRGLDVELIANTSGQNAVAAGLRGEIDVMYGPQSNIVTAVEQGECFKVLTSGHRNVIDFVAMPDFEMPSKQSDAFPGGLKDLEGKRVGVPNLGSATDRNAQLVLREAGVNTDDVTFIAVGIGPTAITSLENDEVDALAWFPPESSLMDEGEYQYVADLVGSPEESPLSEVIISSPVMTCDFIDSNPETTMEYCKAQWDAWDFIGREENSEAVAAALSKYLNVDDATGAAMWEKYSSTFVTPKLTPEEWEAQAAFNAPGQQTPLPYAETVHAPCAESDPR
ncbi:ABC transporter substrate-binding protein [Dietzia kunjamensis]|uniref:ABC transporter substrate-binding protein n=1 Tax=Dietzia kunjamensis TaxID=322509 RepID=UPI002DBA5551|nr:ABC transporter substrate-binding protein [Dietzia kunjamensis]MEB8326026.1 ABC transporter substrate-binding protein [Dietzia kunjamensis]